MRLSAKWGKRLGIGAAVVVVALVAAGRWVVPALIRGQLRAQLGGGVEFRDWWLGGSSAGLVGLELREGPGASSPVFATAERVETDASLGRLLHGRLMPSRVRIVGPKVTLRLDPKGRFTNLPGARKGGGGGPAQLPALELADAEVTFRPEGRPEMVIKGISASLDPGPRGSTLTARADDPTWGRWTASGAIAPAFQSGTVTLAGDRVEVDREKVNRVPFVPAEVWSHVVPEGPAAVKVTVDWGGTKPVGTHSEVTLLGGRASFPSLGLNTTGAAGRIVVDDAIVRAEGVHGRSIGGAVTASGTLDFATATPRIDLDLGLDRINVAEAPKSWQLDETGITGLLTGRVRLRAVLGAQGVDLSGSSGEATVEGGEVEGIPVKSLRLVMRAQGDDLQFETKAPTAARLRPPGLRGLAATPGLPSAIRGVGLSALAYLVAVQPAAGASPAPSEPKKPAIQLPKSLTTQIELEDVEMAQLIAKAQFLLGFPFPIPISGKLSVKADATIPLGRLRDIKAYAFHGDLTLKGASIYKVDLGRVSARIDLADGVLELKDFRGRLVDHPNGGPDNPPQALPPDVPAEGPLPPGGFRGTLRAELSPPGKLMAHFEGADLPLGELTAPVLPRPTPLDGLAALRLDASADLNAATDPAAWVASGDARSVRITYQGATLDAVAVRFGLKGGVLDVPALSAQLGGRPLNARLNLHLAGDRAFQGALDVSDWDLAAILALVPGAPRPSPVAGTVDAHAEARGTLNPRLIRTEGRGRFGRLVAGPVTLGDVPFRWTTEGDAIVLSGIEAHPFGGRLAAEARVPVSPGKPTEGSASVVGLDTALLSAAIPGEGLKLTGRADGQVQFRIPADLSAVEATVRLNAPDLTVQGIPAERVHASVRAHHRALGYEVTADSLGGKVRFKGDFPLGRAAAPIPGPANQGELQAVGFSLGGALKALGMTGPAAQLDGLGAIDANLRQLPAGPNAGLWAHGLAEFRNLSWGKDLSLGRLRGEVVLSPGGWRVDPLDGALFGGPAAGFLWGSTPTRGVPRRLGFEIRVDRADLRQALAFRPTLARSVEGYGSFRMAGELNQVLRATAEFDVASARLLGLPLSELKAPAELVLAPESGVGTVRLRRWSSRFAGGQVGGEITARLGQDRSFQAEVQLSSVDLEALSRTQSDARRPNSGRISGKISLNGPSPTQLDRFRGRVVLDVDDASIVNLPILGALDRFLGAASGGLFEDGDLLGSIANKELAIETLTLEGRLAQLHATGTVGFDGQLNLEVLVNTNQIIPQTGQALVGLIPGLREAVGRSQEATLRVANYLSNRLLKLRVTGTIRNPSIAADPGIAVGGTAVAFFGGVLKLPLGLVK